MANDTKSLVCRVVSSYPVYPNLSVDPIYPINTIPIWDTAIVGIGKIEQRNGNFGNAKLSFSFSYNKLTTTDKELLENFFNDREGRFERFKWINPDNDLSYIVRFDFDSLGFSYTQFGQWQISNISLMEVVLTQTTNLVSRVTVTS